VAISSSSFRFHSSVDGKRELFPTFFPPSNRKKDIFHRWNLFCVFLESESTSEDSQINFPSWRMPFGLSCSSMMRFWVTEICLARNWNTPVWCNERQFKAFLQPLSPLSSSVIYGFSGQRIPALLKLQLVAAMNEIFFTWFSHFRRFARALKESIVTAAFAFTFRSAAGISRWRNSNVGEAKLLRNERIRDGT
jgi:hypothetical protein